MRAEAPRLGLALVPPLCLLALLPPLADAAQSYWVISLPLLIWLRAAAWISGRDAPLTFFYLAMGLPLRAWAWSALGAASWGDLAFLGLADLAACALAAATPYALGLAAAGILGLMVSLASLFASSAALALVEPASAATILGVASGFVAWLAARRRG